MIIVNTVTAPELIVVGAPTLFNLGYMGGMVKYKNAIDCDNIAFASLYVPEKGKVKKVDFVKEAEELANYTEVNDIKVVAVAQADYFKFMTGEKKFDINFGDRFKGVGNLSHLTIIPLLNAKILSMYPNKRGLLAKGVSAINSALAGEDGTKKFKLTKSEKFTDFDGAYKALKELSTADILFCDVEATGLKFESNKLLTISFSKDQETAVCIAIHPKYVGEEMYPRMIKLLKAFFTKFKGKVIYHNAGFDLGFIVHEIMLGGNFSKDKDEIINNMNVGDTLLMAYLVYNSTERFPIGLKDLCYAEYGEYDKDVDQSRLIEYPFETVGEYNNYDTSATCYIHKSLSKTVKPFQELYEKYLDYMKLILKIRMNGLVVDKTVIEESILELNTLIETDTKALYETQEICDTEVELNKLARKKYNSTHKLQKKTSDFNVAFNPNSSTQKRILIFDVMGLSTENTTKTGAPSTDKDTMQELILTATEEQSEILRMLQDITTANKVVGTYLETFLNTSVEVRKGEWRIFGNFNLTGTISGRLSSNNPNLQNIPSGSKYGKLVKRCFIAPEGSLFAGSDYSALEDRLIAIESKSKNKLRVFTDGIDGHSLNAAYYFKDELLNRGIVIDENDKDSINSIKSLAGDLRGDGKSVTFGLAYGGTEYTVAKSLKIPTEEAEEIVRNYNKLNKEVLEYKNVKVQEAIDDGFVISRFSGLRLLTPNIHSAHKATAAKEQRVIGNFSIQSGSILMLDAMVKFQNWLEEEDLLNQIEVISNIHDAIYLYLPNDSAIIARVNKKLIEIMSADYVEDQPITLEAELDVGGNWANMTTLPNNISAEEVGKLISTLAA